MVVFAEDISLLARYALVREMAFSLPKVCKRLAMAPPRTSQLLDADLAVIVTIDRRMQSRRERRPVAVVDFHDKSRFTPQY